MAEANYKLITVFQLHEWYYRSAWRRLQLRVHEQSKRAIFEPERDGFQAPNRLQFLGKVRIAYGRRHVA